MYRFVINSVAAFNHVPYVIDKVYGLEGLPHAV